MIFSHSISRVFLISLRINFSKRTFRNFKIKESRAVTISPKASNKHPKAQSKSNTHINKKKE